MQALSLGKDPGHSSLIEVYIFFLLKKTYCWLITVVCLTIVFNTLPGLCIAMFYRDSLLVVLFTLLLREFFRR
jgi:hypothetical protein